MKALIVGIKDYGQKILPGCESDAIAMAEILRFNEDGSDNMYINLQLNVETQDELLQLVKEHFEAPTDLALFYYSGHGYVNSKGGYLVTPDSKESDAGLSMDTIIKVANESKTLHRVIILDCCYSGAIAQTKKKSALTIDIMEGVTILTASRNNQITKEVKLRGVFTNLLLFALNGGAADIRGNITPGSIYSCIDQALGEFGQRPVFKTHVCRFVTLRKMIPRISKEVLLKIVKYFKTSESPHELDPSYEDTNIKDGDNRNMEPYAKPENVEKLKHLQEMVKVGLVVPAGTKHMYDAAMGSKSCVLTPLGKHYWRLVKEDKA